MTDKKSKYHTVANENKYFKKSDVIQKNMHTQNKYFQKSTTITKSMSTKIKKSGTGRGIPGGDPPIPPITIIEQLFKIIPKPEDVYKMVDEMAAIIDGLDDTSSISTMRSGINAIPGLLGDYVKHKLTAEGISLDRTTNPIKLKALLDDVASDIASAYSTTIATRPELAASKPASTRPPWTPESASTPSTTTPPAAAPSMTDFETSATVKTDDAVDMATSRESAPTDYYPSTLTEHQRSILEGIAGMSRKDVLQRIKEFGPRWYAEPIKAFQVLMNPATEKAPALAQKLLAGFDDTTLENPMKSLERFLNLNARSGLLDRDFVEPHFYNRWYNEDKNLPFDKIPNWPWSQMEGPEKIKSVAAKVGIPLAATGLGVGYYNAQQNNPYWTEEWKDSDPINQQAKLQSLNLKMGKPARDAQKEPSFTDVYIPWGKPSVSKSQVKKKEKNNKITKAGGTGSDAINTSSTSSGGSGGSGGSGSSGGLSSQQALSTAQKLSQFLSRINPLIKKYGVKTAEAIMKKTPGLYEKYKEAYNNPIIQTVINQKAPNISAPKQQTLTDKKEFKNYARNAVQSKFAEEAMQNPITQLGMKTAQPVVSALFSPLIAFDKAKSEITQANKPTKKEQNVLDVMSISDPLLLVNYGDLRQQQNAIDTSKENRVKMQNKLVGNLKVPDYVQSSRNLRPLTDKEKKERDINYKTYLGQLKEVWDRAKTYEPGTTLSTSDKLSNSMSDNYVSGLGVANRSKVNLASAESRDEERKKNQQIAMDYMSGKFKPKTIAEKTSVDMGINALNREKAEAAKQTARAQAKQEKDRKRTDEMAARAASLRSPQPNKQTTAVQPTPQPQKPNKPKRVIAQTKSPYQLLQEAQARNAAQNRNIQNQIAQVITQQGGRS